MCNIQGKNVYIKYLDTRMISVGCIFIYFILSDKSSYRLFQLCPVIKLLTSCTQKNFLRSDCFGDTIKMRLLLSWRSPDIHTQCRCTGGKFMRANIRIWKCFLPQWHIHDKRISTEALTDIVKYFHCNCSQTLQWRHNEPDGVPNYRCLGRLLNLLFRLRSEKTLKLRFIGLCEGNPPVTGVFPSQRTSKNGKCFHWWRHYGLGCCYIVIFIYSSLEKYLRLQFQNPI